MHPAMRITNRRGEVIGSVEEWGRLAAPASYKHWKPDRSAYELASAWSVGEGLAPTPRGPSTFPAFGRGERPGGPERIPGVGGRGAAGGDRRGADTVRCIQRPAQPRPAHPCRRGDRLG